MRVGEPAAAQEGRTIVEGRYPDGHATALPDLSAAWDEQVRSTEAIADVANRRAELDGVQPSSGRTPRLYRRGRRNSWPTWWNRPSRRRSTSSAKDTGRSTSRLGGCERSLGPIPLPSATRVETAPRRLAIRRRWTAEGGSADRPLRRAATSDEPGGIHPHGRRP